MEPIEPFVESSFPAARRDRRKVAKKGSERVGFSSVLESAEGESSSSASGFSGLADPRESIEALLDSVHELGEKLKERVSVTAVRDYKHAVREFLSYVVRNTLALEQHESGPNISKRKRFTLIKVVDQKLEQLAAGILIDQRPQLEILRRIDEISGLLVDLLS